MLSLTQIFGIGITIGGMTVFILNVFMVGLFVSKRLISAKHESAMIHRLIFNFIICDAIQVTPTIYIGLCNVLQKGLLPDDLEVIPGTLNLWTWYMMVLMLVIMAVNRYIAVCHFNKYLMIFTARTSVIFIIIAWTISGIYTVFIQFVVPCCAMVAYYPIFTFLYRNPNNEENLVSEYNPPITQICSVILILFYMRIFFALRKSARQLASAMSSSDQQRRTNQNKRFAIQCVFLSIFYILMIAFYQVFPKLLPHDVLLPYSTIAFCMISHCSINSVLCLVFNPEIREIAKQILCCHKGTASSGATQFLSRSAINTNIAQITLGS